MLNALERQWQQHPPVHLLVAAFVGYEPPDADDVQAPAQGDDPVDAPFTPPPWAANIPASQAVRDATTPEETRAAFERMFFGEVKDVREI